MTHESEVLLADVGRHGECRVVVGRALSRYGRDGDRGLWGILDRGFFARRFDPYGRRGLDGFGQDVDEAFAMLQGGGGDDAMAGIEVFTGRVRMALVRG